MRKVLLLAVVIGLLSAGTQAAGRRVHMEVGLPNGSTVGLAIADGSMARIDLRQNGQFGFEPRIDPIADQFVTIVMFTLKGEERTEMGEVTVTVGGEATDSKTSPTFRVRVTKTADVQ